jgi:hypothetical protein
VYEAVRSSVRPETNSRTAVVNLLDAKGTLLELKVHTLPRASILQPQLPHAGESTWALVARVPGVVIQVQRRRRADSGVMYRLYAQALASTSPGSEERFRARRLLPGMAKRLREVKLGAWLATTFGHGQDPGCLLTPIDDYWQRALSAKAHLVVWCRPLSQRSIRPAQHVVQGNQKEPALLATSTWSAEHLADCIHPAHAAGPRSAAAGGAGEGLWGLRGAAVARVRRHRRRGVRRRGRAAVHCDRQREAACQLPALIPVQVQVAMLGCSPC